MNEEIKSVAAVVKRTAFDVDFIVWLTNNDGLRMIRGGVNWKNGMANFVENLHKKDRVSKIGVAWGVRPC